MTHGPDRGPRMRITPEQLPARIETERLVLRPWEAADAAGLHEALVESVGHLKPWIPWATPEAPTLEQARRRMGVWIEEFRSGVNFVYAAVERSGGGVLGGAGLYPRVGPGGIEVGYWIRLSRAGAGFATEATRALTHAGFGVPGIGRIEIHTNPANLASRRVPMKLGYGLASIRRGERQRDGSVRDTEVYELTLDRYTAEWETAR